MPRTKKLSETGDKDHSTSTYGTKLESPVNFNDPQSFARALSQVAADLVTSNEKVAQAYGLMLKYQADAVSAYLADTKRHDMDESATICGLLNGFSNILALVACSACANEEEAKHVAMNITRGFIETFMRGMAQNYPGSEDSPCGRGETKVGFLH
jgi:hypothetical protein